MVDLRPDPHHAWDGSPSAGSSFHYSFGLLPRDQRRAMESVYAFCRVVDDIADSKQEGPAGGRGREEKELDIYREEIGLCYDGEPTLTVTRELKAWIDRFGIPKKPFDDLLDGVGMDLTRTRYAGFEDLRQYCYRVASTVGLICLPIFGCREPDSREYAVQLGIALQLTNILRDIRSDALRGRIYLPQVEIRSAGYSEEELMAGVYNAQFKALMRQQAERAHRHFDRAAAVLPPADRSRLLVAQVMGAIYRRLLRRIEAGGFRVFERRITVPRLQQVGLAMKAWVTGNVRD